MRISEAKTVLKEAGKSNFKLRQDPRANVKPISIKLSGGVGIGKTSAVYQATSEMFDELGIENWVFRTVNLATEAPDDIAGSNYYPDGDGFRMEKKAPWWFPSHDEPHGCLFLDEYDQAEKAQKNASGPLIDEYKVGPWELPKGWIVVAAGNRKKDRAGTTSNPSQITERWLNIEVDLNQDETLAHFAKIGINEKIRAFLGFAGHEWLHKFDPDAEAFPTPRGWERCNTIMSFKLDDVLMIEAIASKVGGGAAAAFSGFCKVFDQVPDIDELIADPKSANVPQAADTLYAVCALLSTKANMENLGSILEYCGRFESQTFTAMIMRDVRARFGKELRRNPAFKKWVAEGGGKELLV